MSRTQEQINHHVVANYAGIDVSKATLDFAIYGKDTHLSVPNDKLGIQKLKRECVLNNVELVVLEPTGKFHRPLHQQLHDAPPPPNCSKLVKSPGLGIRLKQP